MLAKTTGKIFKIFLRIILWSLVGIIGIFILLIVILQFPQTQNYLSQKAVIYLSKKINSKVELANLTVVFPSYIELTDLYIEDRKNDTLLYSHSLKVGFDLSGILSQNIQLTTIELDGLTAHIYREYPDSSYNFSFIPQAFAPTKQDSVAVTDSTPSSWNIVLNAIQLRNCMLTFRDTLAGINSDLKLGVLNTRFDEFDLATKKLHVGTVLLQNTVMSYSQLPALQKKNTEPQPFDYDVAVGKILFEKVRTLYTDKKQGIVLDADINTLFVDANTIDIKNENIELDKLLLNESRINYEVHRISPVDSLLVSEKRAIKEPSGEKANWKIKLKQIELNKNSFAYDNFNFASIPAGLDYNHLAIQAFSLKSKVVSINPDKIELELQQMQLKEKSGFTLKEFAAVIKYDSTGAELAGLNIETSNSKISRFLSVRYPSIRSIKDSIDNIDVNLDLKRTSIGMADVLLFVPDLKSNPSFKAYQSSIVNINGKISGKLDNLSIEELVLSTKLHTEIKLKGRIQSVRKPEKMYADFPVIEFTSTNKELYLLLPEKALPQNIVLPEAMHLNASFTGYMKNFDADVNVATSIGGIIASVKMNSAADRIEEEYTGDIAVNNFNVGALLGREQKLGTVTLTAAVKGCGYSTSNLNAQFNTNVTKAVLKGYTYSDFKMDGTIQKTVVTANASMNDKNIVFDLDAIMDIDSLNPFYKVNLNLKGADFSALNLSEDDLRVSGQLSAKVKAVPEQNITGKAELRNMLIIRSDKKYSIDSLVVLSEEENGTSSISIQSDIIDAGLNGKIVMNELSESLNRHLNTYFVFAEQKSVKTLQPQKFTFQVAINNPVLLSEIFFPAVNSPMPSSIKGEFDSNMNKLLVDVNVPQVSYVGIRVDTLKVNIDSDKEMLNYSLRLSRVSNDVIELENVSLNGGMHDNSLNFRLISRKGKSTEMLDIGGQLKKQNEDFVLHLNSDIKLNNTKWLADSANYIQFGKNGLIANQVILSDGNQAIRIHSQENNAAAPLEVQFTNFELSTISKIVEKNEGLISGVINGNALLRKQGDIPGITSDITVKTFSFNKFSLGDIALQGDSNESPDKYNIHLSINGNGNDIDVLGYYVTAPANKKLNFTIDLKNINIASIEPYTFGKVSSMTGTAYGKLNISGDVSAPEINGAVNFKSTTFKPSLIDSYLKVEQGQIRFDSKKIRFDSFTLLDSLNNKAIIDGYVDVANLKEIDFDLRLRTDNFLALNTLRKGNSLYYGKVFLNSDISVKGSPDLPVVKVNARINKGSSITYIKPESSVAENEGEGVVEFIVVDSASLIMTDEKTRKQMASAVKGIDLKAIIDFDKEAQLKMIVDQVSGDSVYVKGEGSLEFSLDAEGKTNLTGKYNMVDGGYHLSIGDLVKKDFKIAPGSYVTWAGDIMDAYVDLKAIYTIKTSAVDLLEEELAGLDELQKNKYRNLVTFLVYLKMSGFISSPLISFDIQLPDKEKGTMNGAVNAKLSELRADETELNKQVFALLTLNRFIGEDPLQSGGGPASLSATSRRSASRMLSQQLNTLSAKYVKGVDLNLGVNSYEDYSSGKEEGRTQLQLGVSKQLFNDKVTVQVGGNVDVEGEKAKQNNASDIAGNIVVEYKLTDDGRYRLKAFRESEYENPIEGELIKTGGGLIFSKDYRTLRDLFKKHKKAAK